MSEPSQPPDHRPPAAGPPAADAPGFRALAARLRAIAERARTHGWRAWSREDDDAIEAAAREIAAFEESLATGMRNAFEIGREYGKQEGVLQRLDDEIAAATGELARTAWGRKS